MPPSSLDSTGSQTEPPRPPSFSVREFVGRWGALAASHAVGAALAAVAVFFTLWATLTGPARLEVLQCLLLPWQAGGGAIDWAGVSTAVALVILCMVVGWFYLEGLELYLPVGGAIALAFLFGLCLTGFCFEALATFHWLGRGAAAAVLVAALAALAARAWRRARQAPCSGVGGDAGYAEHLMRRAMARQAYRATLSAPAGPAGWLYCIAALGLIVGITFFIFWHSLLYPEVYWDSLILYLGYARMTFLEGGFPLKVTGQVGIGLGANYPHLYAALGAGAATLAGRWSEVPQQLIASLCGVASTVLVYHTALRLTRHVNASLALALLYRAIPLGIAYDTYASDYAMAMLMGAAFLYLALLYISTALPGYLVAATLLIGLAMHLNYLMGILWLPWGVTLLTAHLACHRADRRVKRTLRTDAREASAPWVALTERPSLAGLLQSPWLWRVLVAAGLIGATWLVRNWIVTGNPVYAFFYKILGGDRINPEVMEAAAREWQANGAGIGRLDEFFPNRLWALWTYFTGIGPDLHWPQAYRTAPLLMAFSLSGVAVWVGRLVAARRKADPSVWGIRLGWVVLSLAGGLLAFHLLLAPFYLYQIITILPCLALLAALAWPGWRMRPWRWVLGALALWIGLVPGLTMSMMGFKVAGIIQLPGGRQESPGTLYPLRHPLPSASVFYRWRYGDDARMFDYVNDHLAGQKLLTHENRHLVYDPTIKLVHLDDWEIQPLWKELDSAQRVRRLIHEQGIEYYLFVPNELACATNARMGTAQWPSQGLAELVFEAGENRLYRLLEPKTPPSQSEPPVVTAPVPAELSQSTPPPAPPESLAAPAITSTPVEATGTSPTQALQPEATPAPVQPTTPTLTPSAPQQ